MTRVRRSLYQGAGAGMLRAAVNLGGPDLLRWPGRAASSESWRSWLASACSDDAFRQAIAVASPDLDGQVQAILAGPPRKVRRVRRAALAVARYAIRYTRRSTPFGLFAGVALVGFGDTTEVDFGTCHRTISRPDPVALDAAICEWEADGERMVDVEVCVSNLARQANSRVYVPSEGASEFSLALTPAVAFILATARSPIRYATLANKLAAEFPGTDEHHRSRLLGQLLRVRLLRSSLRAPATVTNPADPLPRCMDEVVRSCAGVPDLRLDATVRLPTSVLTEAETAATALTRLAVHPAGIPAWRRYAEQFVDRYGEGVEVPLELVIDPGKGLGLPEGFGRVFEPPRAMTRRDRLLLELAGATAIEGHNAVVLPEAMIERLEAATGKHTGVAPHLEVCGLVEAASQQAMNRGDFRLRVSTISRGAGSMQGRFWHLFPGAGAACAELPTVDPAAELVQLSFHPSRVPADPLTRAPQVLPRLVSVGEFRRPDNGVLFPSDLAVVSVPAVFTSVRPPPANVWSCGRRRRSTSCGTTTPHLWPGSLLNSAGRCHRR